MNSSQFISVRETAQILAISEKKVMELVEEQKLQAYRIADQFLRLKREEVLNLRNTDKVKRENIVAEYSAAERVQDFFYYNDFYMLCAILIAILIFVIITY